MPVELTRQQQEAIGAEAAVWFTAGAWWIVSLGEDETVIVPEDRPRLPAQHLN